MFRLPSGSVSTMSNVFVYVESNTAAIEAIAGALNEVLTVARSDRSGNSHSQREGGDDGSSFYSASSSPFVREC